MSDRVCVCAANSLIIALGAYGTRHIGPKQSISSVTPRNLFCIKLASIAIIIIDLT